MISPSLFNFPSISIFYFGKNNNNKIWILIDELFIGLLPPPPLILFLMIQPNYIQIRKYNWIYFHNRFHWPSSCSYLFNYRERKKNVRPGLDPQFEPDRTSFFPYSFRSMSRIAGRWHANAIPRPGALKRKKPFDLRFSTESEIFSTPTSI